MIPSLTIRGVLVIYSLAKDWNSQGHERMFLALLSSCKFVVEICRWYSDYRGVSMADLRVDKIPPGWQSNRRP
jgi:hypothetical protein